MQPGECHQISTDTSDDIAARCRRYATRFYLVCAGTAVVYGIGGAILRHGLGVDEAIIHRVFFPVGLVLGLTVVPWLLGVGPSQWPRADA